MNAREFQDLQDRVSKLQRDKDRAEGAISEIKKKMFEQFEVNNLEDAEKLLADLQKEESRTTILFESSLKEFEEVYGDSVS